MFSSTALSEETMASDMRDITDDNQDFQHHFPRGKKSYQGGAPYTKDEIRGMKKPSPEVWTDLSASMWIRKTLRDMPHSHPDRTELLQRLKGNERFLAELSRPSASSSRPRQDSSSTEHLTADKDISTHFQDGIFMPSNGDVLSNNDGDSSNAMGFFPLPIGRDALHVITFDLREACGFLEFDDWFQECPDEANVIREIIIKHLIWIYDDVESRWSAIDADTTFSLLPSGDVKVIRRNDLDHHARPCHCDDEFDNDEQEQQQQEEEDEECGEELTSIRTLPDFVRALSQNPSHLVTAACKFVHLIGENDEIHEPVLCRVCEYPIFYRRIYRGQASDSEDMAPAALNVTSSAGAPPPIPPKSAWRSWKPRGGYKDRLSLQEDYCSLLDRHPLESHEASSLRSPSVRDSFGGDTLEQSLDGCSALENLTCETAAHSLPVRLSESPLNIPAPETPTRIDTSTVKVESPQSVVSDERTGRDDISTFSTSPSTASSPPSSSGVPSPGDRDFTQRLSQRFSSWNLRGRMSGGGPMGEDARGSCESVAEERGKAVDVENVRSDSKRRGGRSFGRKLIAGWKRK